MTLTAPGDPSREALLKRLEQQSEKHRPAPLSLDDYRGLLKEFGLPLIRVKSAPGVAISGIRVTHPLKGDQNRLLTIGLIESEASRVSLAGAVIAGGPGDGVEARNGSDLVISNCLIAAHWGTGVAIGGGNDTTNHALIIDSEIRNCYHRGITIRSDRPVRVERCRISGSAWHGIRYDGCSPTIEGCLIADNARSGIYASGTTAATIRNNVFWNNDFSAWFSNRDVIEQNTFICPGRGGISLIGESRPAIRGNLFVSNEIAIAQSTSEKVDVNRIPSLDRLAITNNAFWSNRGVWRAFRDRGPSSQGVAGSPLASWGNRDVEVDLPKLPADFRPGSEFRARHSGIGSSAPFPQDTPWPLQPEEISIIPKGRSRDYQLWRNE